MLKRWVPRDKIQEGKRGGDERKKVKTLLLPCKLIMVFMIQICSTNTDKNPHIINSEIIIKAKLTKPLNIMLHMLYKTYLMKKR